MQMKSGACHAPAARHRIESMIPKSGYRFSEKIMLQQEAGAAMTTRRKVIALERMSPRRPTNVQRTVPVPA
jgi:hypothetical protein